MHKKGQKARTIQILVYLKCQESLAFELILVDLCDHWLIVGLTHCLAYTPLSYHDKVSHDNVSVRNISDFLNLKSSVGARSLTCIQREKTKSPSQSCFWKAVSGGMEGVVRKVM